MKLRSWILVAVLVLVAVFTLTACEGKCEHAYESEITAEATCAAEGKTTFTCSKCGDTYTESIAKTAHTYTETVEEATCIADGKKTYTCVCGDTYSETISAKGHSYTETVVAPTCTEEGYTLHACGACGRTYTDTPVAAKGHSYTAKTTASTCAVNGNITYSCACGHYYMEALPKADHTYTVTSVVAPTCLEGGYSNLLCSVCGQQTKGEFTTATGHKHTPVVTAPTCIAEGYTTHVCVCGDSYKDTPTPATGIHTYEKKIIALTDAEAAANPDAIAIEAMVCTGCDKVDETANKNAVLLNLDFETLPTDIESYVGSTKYQTILNAGKLSSDESTRAAILIDSQKNMDIHDSNSWGGVLNGDGKLTMTQLPSFFADNLQLASQKPAVPQFTISFDLTVNRDPATTGKNPTFIWSFHDNKIYNTKPVVLALPSTPVAPKQYELTVISYNSSAKITHEYDTGYLISLGKNYSFKLMFTTGDVYAFALFIQAEGEAEYTLVGVYEYTPHVTSRTTLMSFANSSHAGNNVVDNLKIVAPAQGSTCTHEYDSAVTKAATCGEDGVETFVCVHCGDLYTEKLPATGEHDYKDTVVAPTCVDDGYTRHTCGVCGDFYDDTPVSATGSHSYTIENTVEPTCGADGYTRHTCDVCGGFYDDTPVSATGNHSYTESVVEPTCGADGYTRHTCGVCGSFYDDTPVSATGAHNYAYGVYAPTEAQLAKNPNAIGVEGEFCTVCNAIKPETTATAVLIDLDFEEVPNVGSYEGSDAYQATLTAAGSAATNDVKAFLAYFDSQKNVALEGGWGATKASLIQNGKYVCTNNPVYIVNDLGLSLSKPAVASYTMTFDTVVNVTGKTDSKLVDATQFFALTDNKKYNNRTLVLALNQTDVDTNADDDVHTYELVAASLQYGTVKVKEATGYKITLGKEYSFKLVVTPSAKSYELYVKEAGATEYTSVGTYSYAPAGTISCINFALSSTNNGNIFDNFKVTTAYVAE